MKLLRFWLIKLQTMRMKPGTMAHSVDWFLSQSLQLTEGEAHRCIHQLKAEASNYIFGRVKLLNCVKSVVKYQQKPDKQILIRQVGGAPPAPGGPGTCPLTTFPHSAAKSRNFKLCITQRPQFLCLWIALVLEEEALIRKIKKLAFP